MSARSSGGSDSEDEPPQLSEHAQAALLEFYSERAAQEQELQVRLEQGAGPVHLQEDWQLSQFWYDDATATVLAKEALDRGRNKRIACVSCPTLYAKLVEIKPTVVQTFLLEYDKRFEAYGEDFVLYDYRQPLSLPEKLEKHSFDIVVADPPFLSEECLQKVAQTINHLTTGRILLCTGAVMESSAYQLLALKPCSFVPKHTRNLANEFRCYVNYDPAILNTCKV